jgi:Kef-type K+ transport system membrane component KefB
VSTLIPLACGAGLAVFLYPRLSSPAVNVWDYALFLGTALSITAFPVLARLLVERGLIATRVGSLSLSIAAVGDVVAWCLLAVVVARSSNGSGHPLWMTLCGLLVFIVVMGGLIRPIVSNQRWFDPERPHGLSLLLGFVFVASWTTEWIGVHALFGAFFAGVVLPKSSRLARSVTQRLEAFTSILLLPLFFAFTGLRTSIGLLNSGLLWLYCGLVIAVAIASKLFGCAITARSMGVSWRDAFATGALLNTRGLVELVVLNIGLDLHVISPTLFSMMVVMALVTTFMANPLLHFICPSLVVSAPRDLTIAEALE